MPTSYPELQVGRDLSCQKLAAPRQLEPLPTDPLGHRLCEIFSYRWQAILANGPNCADQKPAWYTETRYPLRPRVLWNLWQDAQQLVGVRFGSETTYALIDIDRTSPYHPQQSHQAIAQIQQALEAIGLCRSLLVQSSWSGGLHLYVPLSAAVPTFGLAIALRNCLEQHGFHLRAGHLEVFPNVKRYGKSGEFVEYNAHRLPLQPGSGSLLLRPNFQPCPGGLAEFFDQWAIAAAGQDVADLQTAIATARQTFRPVRANGNNRFTAWQQDLETDMQSGWTSTGQTNYLLKTIACHGVVFRSLSGDDLVQYIYQTAVNAPGYGQWCQHQHEIRQRCADWAIAAERHYWSPQRSSALKVRAQTDPQAISANAQRAQAAQDRIQQAVQTLLSNDQLPASATARAQAIAQLARCSFSTLQKYRELWHPDQAVITLESGDRDGKSTAADSPKNSVQPKIHQGLQAFLYMKGFYSAESAIGETHRSGSGLGGYGGNFSLPTHIPQADQLTNPGELSTARAKLNELRDQTQSPQSSLRSPLSERLTSPGLTVESGPELGSYSSGNRGWDLGDLTAGLDLSDILAKISVQQRRLHLDRPSFQIYVQALFGQKPYEYLNLQELERLHKHLCTQAQHPVIAEHSPDDRSG